VSDSRSPDSLESALQSPLGQSQETHPHNAHPHNAGHGDNQGHEGVTRRDFLRASMVTAVAVGIGVQDALQAPGQPVGKPANEFLPNPLETHVLGASSVLGASRASLRIATLDHRDRSPIRNAGVRVTLITPGGNNGKEGTSKEGTAKKGTAKKEITLFKGYTNRRGTVDASFAVPPLPKGTYELRVSTTSSLGTDSFSTPLTVTDATQVLLTTDKPLYQPGQILHLRTLSLARPDLLPVAGQRLTFEVEDAKGNKVFKKEITTSKFGVAATQFVLGNEINRGRYTVRAVLGDMITERKVTVDQYVLPKFKVKVTTDKKYYLPGEGLKGTLQVDYFFGKAVAGGEVAVELSTFDVGFHSFAQLKGKTDASGTYNFETKLPDSFVGLPLEQGNALVQMAVSVTDKAEHREEVTHTVPVSKDAVKVTVLPESGALLPGVENTLYVLTSYPDGAPAATRFSLKSNGIDLSGTTDPLGIGAVKLTPLEGLQKPKDDSNREDAAVREGAAFREEDGFNGFNAPFPAPSPSPASGRPLEITVTARDARGNTGATTTRIARRVSEESLLLRTDKAIARVGETLNVEIISTRQSGTVYVDLVKDKQTMLTQSVETFRGRGDLRLDLDEELAGTLLVHAYLITPRGEIIRDTRLVYVNPANDLKISVTADKAIYRPGSPARITMKVTDGRGHPVLAALGVNIVDESVFALQEMQPGMEKVYFTLEKELLEPKVEVHGFGTASGAGVVAGFTPEDIIATAQNGGQRAARLNPDKQKVARVLFAAAQPLVDYGINWNSYQQKQQGVMQKWYERVSKDAARFGKALDEYRRQKSKFPDRDAAVTQLLAEKLLTPADLQDALGTPYQLRPRSGQDFNNGFVLISAGIDKQLGTGDDVFIAGYPGGYIAATRGRLRMRRERRAGARDEFEEFVPLGMPGPMGPGGMGGGAAFGAKDDRAVNGKLAILAMPPATTAASRSVSEASASSAPEEPVRVRQYFPETLFVAPNVLTDEKGNATLSLDMADSITSWRLTSSASSAQGALGSTTSPLRVFQDFFVDIDLPVSLTQHDEVSIPVAVYNYLPTAQTVRLKLETTGMGAGEGSEGGEGGNVAVPAGPWCELVSGEAAERTVTMDANQVGVVYYRIQVKGIGVHPLAVTARGSKLSDAVRRSVEVLPDGKAVWETVNDRLEGDVAKTMVVPESALTDASNILVRLYPGAFSQIVDGLDKLLQMPYGCFEQNASVAYPNILVMDYLKKTKQLKPELQMKVESYINAGYQRALTYEVKGGGFSWFGDAPAHKVLTSYGVLMFGDMSRVHFVDPGIIARTQNWLAAQQKPDGSWEVDKTGIAEGIINRQTDVLRVTAYVAWALAETGYSGPQLAKAASYITARIGEVPDAYAAAVVANALVAIDKNADSTGRALEKLAGLKTEEGKVAYWNNKTPTFTGAQGGSADIETTGLAVYALLRSGRYGALVNKVLTYLVQHKDPQGTWGSTQATVWALRALLAGMDKATGETNGEAIIRLNGRQVSAFAITPRDSDVMRQVELKEHVQSGENRVEIKWSGAGSPLYAISSNYYLPWHGGQDDGSHSGQAGDKSPLQVEVSYDRTELAVNDIVTCRVKVRNTKLLAADMVLVDLGVPPGFEVQAEDLAELAGSKKIQKFSLTGRQVIVYLEKVGAGETLGLEYRLKAKLALKAKTPKSVVYEYYTPSIRSESKPVAMVVNGVNPTLRIN
jgi:hypothetical protein